MDQPRKGRACCQPAIVEMGLEGGKKTGNDETWMIFLLAEDWRSLLLGLVFIKLVHLGFLNYFFL